MSRIDMWIVPPRLGRVWKIWLGIGMEEDEVWDIHSDVMRGPLFSPGKLRGACYSLLRRRRQATGLLLKRVFPGIEKAAFSCPCGLFLSTSSNLKRRGWCIPNWCYLCHCTLRTCSLIVTSLHLWTTLQLFFEVSTTLPARTPDDISTRRSSSSTTSISMTRCGRP